MNWTRQKSGDNPNAFMDEDSFVAGFSIDETRLKEDFMSRDCLEKAVMKI